MSITLQQLRELQAVTWLDLPSDWGISYSTQKIMYLNILHPSANLERMIEYRLKRGL